MIFIFFDKKNQRYLDDKIIKKFDWISYKYL